MGRNGSEPQGREHAIKGEPIAKPTTPENWVEDMDKRFSEHVPEYVSATYLKVKPSSRRKANEPVKLHGPTKKPVKQTKSVDLTGSAQLEEHPTNKHAKQKKSMKPEVPAKLCGPTLSWLRSTVCC